ncbi:two-component regulator propeller domain-containing protein [Algoriphagus sp. D3-2-R+10]|uniref:sensor histidine kinase n=1 Tax=Algoriphagus aurantiacus TaxID=3103948 RepID=UPI002B3AC8E8|nr:two-component regulator propeller domain-containing protein [Algoriphagus sp. D3-2-R+10]MEB2773681.1 two-component regulator propeller domain-containing protein [Algoriphagus sp. D3-2-R+10]
MFRRSIFHIIVFIISLSTTGIVTARQQEFKEEWYDSQNDALPQNSVKGIVKDKYGYLWLFTENGLVRFDGQRFHLFGLSGPHSIENNRTGVLGFSRIDQDSIFGVTNWTKTFVISRRQVAKVPDFRTGIPHLNDPYLQIEMLGDAAFIPDPTYDISYLMDFDDASYLILYQHVIRFFDANHQEYATVDFERDLYTRFFKINKDLFLTDKKGIVWRVSSDSLCLEKTIGYLPSEGAVILNRPMNQSFYYFDKKLYLLSYSSGQIQKEIILEGYQVDWQTVNTIYYDQEYETIYLGTSSRGLGRISPKLLKNNNSPSKVQVFYSQALMEDGNVLVANGDVFDQKGNYLHTIPLLPFSDEKGILFDKEGRLWCKNGEELFCLRVNKDQVDVIKKWDFGSEEITNISQDFEGTLWVSTSAFLQGQGCFYKMDAAEPVLMETFDFRVNHLLTNQEAMYLGTDKGLYKKSWGFFDKMESIAGLENTYIRSLYEDTDGGIWITTYSHGLFYYRNGKLSSLPLDPQGYLLSSHCLLEDKKGCFWITTNKGLFHVTKRSLIRYINRETKDIHYYYFNNYNGLSNIEFNGGSQPCGLYLSEENMISFPNMNGLVAFSPNELDPMIPQTKIFLDHISVDEVPYMIQDTVTLLSEFSRLEIEVSSPYFDNPKNLHMEYQLSSDSKNVWFSVPNDGKIQFSTLPHGRYNLTVRKPKGKDGVYEQKQITIVIPPKFWQTIVFKISCLTLTAVLLGCAAKFRIQYLHDANQQLENRVIEKTGQLQKVVEALKTSINQQQHQLETQAKLSQIITHDIRTPLKYLSLFSSNWAKKHKGGTSEVSEAFRNIKQSSDAIFKFAEHVLNTLSKEEISSFLSPTYSIRELLENKLEIFAITAQLHHTKILLNIHENPTTRIKREFLSIIIHNLLDNALKNTLHGTIWIDCAVYTFLTVQIRDSGKGMTAQQVSFYQNMSKTNDNFFEKNLTGLGLPMVIDLVRIMNGVIEIDSKPDFGTRITLRFPHYL